MKKHAKITKVKMLDSIRQLPYPVITSIIPFKDVLVYDGMFFGFSIDFGSSNFNITAEKEYNQLPKYYQL